MRQVTMPCGRKFRIFCDMTNKLNGGRAVTFLSPEGLTMLGQANYDLGPLLSDKSAVVVRSLLSDGTQNSALLQQLDHLKYYLRHVVTISFSLLLGYINFYYASQISFSFGALCG